MDLPGQSVPCSIWEQLPLGVPVQGTASGSVLLVATVEDIGPAIPNTDITSAYSANAGGDTSFIFLKATCIQADGFYYMDESWVSSIIKHK